MRIVKLVARDVLRLTAVEIEPSGNVVTLGGRNGAGKSAVLDSIALALGGKRATPEVPIRRGAKRAEVVLDLGDLVVERVITQGGDRLIVKGADGQPVRSPQAALDRIVGAIAFDPLSFARMPAREQAETLRALVGLDTSGLDAERERVFAERTQVNRDGQALRARVDAMPHHDDAPEAEVSVAALAEELDRRGKIAVQNERLRREEQQAVEVADRQGIEVQRLTDELATARRRLAEADAQAKLAMDATVGLVDPDVSGLLAQIAGAEAANRKGRENAAHKGATAELETARATSQALTTRLDVIDAAKRVALVAAKFPVPGLGIDPDGAVVFGGLPFAQASSAEKLRTSVAMACAANPELRVFFVRDGSLLDADGLRLIAEMAAQHDAQVWIEDARTTSSEAVIIEDGHVAGFVDEPAPAMPSPSDGSGLDIWGST